MNPLLDNGDLLEILDERLDGVDEVLRALDLDHDIKKSLVSSIYELYADAEKAVCDKFDEEMA